VNFIEAVEGIGQHLKTFAVEAAAKVEQELPMVQQLAQQASANPAVVALLSAVHLPEVPELLQALANEITQIEASLAAAKAQGAAAVPAADPAPAA
jgi:hypothetical protein